MGRRRTSAPSLHRTSIEELRRKGRREPLTGPPNPPRACVWCGTETLWRLRDHPVCLHCNDKGENRGEDGLADVERLREVASGR